MLRNAKKSDIDELVKIHLHELCSDFLPSLGEEFLYQLYLDLFQNRNTYMLVAYVNNDIQGFIVGSNYFSKVFKNIIIGNFIRYSVLIIPQVIKNPALLKNIFDTMFYAKKEGNNVPVAELVIIAISKKYHHRGLGRQLILALERIFLRNGIGAYKVSVNANNLIADTFYKSLNFKYAHTFSLYGKKINLYIKQIE